MSSLVLVPEKQIALLRKVGHTLSVFCFAQPVGWMGKIYQTAPSMLYSVDGEIFHLAYSILTALAVRKPEQRLHLMRCWVGMWRQGYPHSALWMVHLDLSQICTKQPLLFMKILTNKMYMKNIKIYIKNKSPHCRDSWGHPDLLICGGELRRESTQFWLSDLHSNWLHSQSWLLHKTNDNDYWTFFSLKGHKWCFLYFQICL